MRRVIRRLFAALARTVLPVGMQAACFLAAGCTVGPDYHPPRVDMPAGWATPVGPAAAKMEPTTQSATTAAPPPELIAEWWTTFGDPVLDSLVRRSLESNLDLRQAAARVRQARAARQLATAGFFPTVDTSASYRRSRATGGVTGRTITPDDPDVPGGVVRERTRSGRDLYQAGLDAAWELDVFGGVRRSVEAAGADYRAAVEDGRDVLTTLVAEVALAYTDLRGLQQQVAIARENLESQRRTADVTRRRFGGGQVGALDVANSDALVASTESQIPLLEASARQTIYSLSVLLGAVPGALVEELSAEAPIPVAPPEVPVGLPSDLLRRRPDIRRAEADLHAATARIGVATADLFPRFALTGSLGVQGSHVRDLSNWGNRTWSFGPSVSWPLFDAGRIRANVAIQTAAQEQALAAYRSTVLVAIQDVENALVAYVAEQEHRSALERVVAANRRAVDLSLELYTRGLTDFLNVLSAQRSLYNSEESLADSNRTMAANVIALYKALGGGWERPAAAGAGATSAFQ